MRKNKFLKKTVVKWIISLVLFISITITIISISLYNWYALDNIKLYSDMAESTLKNTSKSVDVLDTTLKNVGFLAVYDKDYTEMMCSNSVDTFLYGTLQKKIMNLIFTNPIIDSAYLVNKKANWVIGSPSLDWIQAGPYSDTINRLVYGQKQNAIIRINTYRTRAYSVNNNSGTEDTISYVFFLTRDNTSEDSFLILNIKQSNMMKTLDNIGGIAGSEVLVTDMNGKVVLSEKPEQLYKEYGSDGFMRRIFESKSSSGFFNYTENSAKSLVAYVKSEKSDYYFISITPYEIVRKTAIALKNKTAVLSIAILFMGLIAAIIIAMHFYSPMKRLVKKYASNSHTANEMNPVEYINEYELLDKLIEHNYNKVVSLDGLIRQDYLKKLLEGKINIDHEFSKNRLHGIGVNLSHGYYKVIYMTLDNLDGMKKNPAEMHALKQGICEVSEDCFKLICNCEMVWEINDESVVALLNYNAESPDMDNRIKSACASIQEYSQAKLEARLTIAIGKAGINEVHSSFQDAADLLCYKLKYGDGSIIDQERVTGDISGYDLFPENEEKYLLRYLRSLSLEKSSECIRQIVKEFYKYSISDILRAVNHILYSTLQVAKEMIKNRDVSGEIDFFCTYERSMKYKSLQEMEDNLISFYGNIIRDMEKTINGNDDGQSVMIRRAIDFIKKNYSNPSISLEYVAEYIKLNPSYLGKLFKESTGIHFTEYINQLRLDSAKELLANTNESINNISSLVGFNSNTYFVTCFKKYTGLTPAKFR
jgi:two-component system, response regulator YesN